MSVVSPSKGFLHGYEFNEASEDSVSLILSCVPLHFPYEGKCQNKVASGDEEASGHD